MQTKSLLSSLRLQNNEFEFDFRIQRKSKANFLTLTEEVKEQTKPRIKSIVRVFIVSIPTWYDLKLSKS